MSRRIVAIDFDDVIIESVPNILAHYNMTYGTKVPLKDFYSSDNDVWGADLGLAVERVNNYLASAEFSKIEPFQESIDVLKELSQSCELHIVTGRSDMLAEATRGVVDEYFPEVFESIELTNFMQKKNRSKAEVCQKLEADYFVDDHLHHAEIVADSGVQVLLFGDYPWNQTPALGRNMRRVENWREAAAIIMSK